MIEAMHTRAQQSEGIKRYMADIKSFTPLSREAETELTGRIQDGDTEALNILVRANLRFVMRFAREYQGRGLAFEDLVSEGNIGLLKAAQRFDADHGVKFISYAVWWIRQSILAALAQYARTVRLPAHRLAMLRQLAEADRKPEKRGGTKNGRMQQPDARASSYAGGAGFHNSRCLSLEQPALSPDVKLLDIIKDDSAQSPDHGVLQESLQEDVDQILATLEPREAEILRLYFGLHGRRPRNLDEIGRQMRLSKERVRQIKEKALQHVRHGRRSEPLREYMS